MVTDKLKELEATRAKLASLEQSIQSELGKELASLPAKYGFASAEDFLDAARAALGSGKGRRGGARRGRPPGTGKGGPGKKRRSRAVITDETRAQVKKMVEGGKTGSEISKSLGISLPSVQNIKKALGLVKKR
ncbi:MAG: helix-turn-helix domain-containing protein [Verrucomicrobiota bacterium]